MIDNEINLIPEDIRNDYTKTSYTKVAMNNIILYKFVREPNTKEWIKFPQHEIDKLNAERKATKPIETYDERKERLEKARLRREAKQKAEEDFEDDLEYDDFDNEIEIAHAEELLRMLKKQEAYEIDYKED